MSDSREKQDLSDVEARFFGEYEGEEVDPELVALAHGPNALFPFILLLLIAFSAFLVHQYWRDAAYFFADEQPAVLGDVVSWYSGDNFRVEEGQLVLPENRYAVLEGVTQRRAVVGDRGFAKLVGVPVFAEVDAELLHESSSVARTMGELLDFGGDRHVVQAPGRLISFSKLPIRYRGLEKYFSRVFEMEICGVRGDAELSRVLRSERERQILMLGEDLGRPPTETEILQQVGPACQEAWLYQEGVRPQDHRSYVVGVSVVAVVFLSSLIFLALWIRRYREFHAS